MSLKEIQLSPNIGQNDIDYRIKQANKFLEKGNQVKVTLSFRGRERVHDEIGLKTIQDFINSCEKGMLTGMIKMIDGRKKYITATLNPKGKNNGKKSN